ncbi:hypothetical protein [Ralstonia sp.]|uniref:hypothetical protein n=1 Tax=Ralstonia sp. TaxID=54061 RepID=UPI00257D0070|nr:hypothetical protein [Ralstonia sp.]MBA4281677.1 hypothetical protein [Ralstonia sp.]
MEQTNTPPAAGAFDHMAYLRSAVALGDAFVATLNSRTRDLSIKKLPWPLDDNTRFPFERVLQMTFAQAAIEGDPDREPDIALINSAQISLAWDRVVRMIPSALAADFASGAVPANADMRRLFDLPSQITYFGLDWRVGANRFHGLWVKRDRHPISGDLKLLVQLVGGESTEAASATFVLPHLASWDEAVAHAWADLARDLSMASGPDSAQRMAEFTAKAYEWESLFALLWALSDAESFSRANQLARGAPANDLNIRSIEVPTAERARTAAPASRQ